jgi:hypothetical protein
LPRGLYSLARADMNLALQTVYVKKYLQKRCPKEEILPISSLSMR